MICKCGCRESICGINYERCRNCEHEIEAISYIGENNSDFYQFRNTRIWRKSPQKGQAELKELRKKRLTKKYCVVKALGV